MHEVMIGRHAFWFEPQDLLCAEVHGDISAEEMTRFAAYARARAGHCASLLVLADLSEMGEVSTEARKAARAAVGIQYQGTAVYGASFQQRLVATLVLGAVRLLSRNESNRVGFLGDEAEARRWIAARRLAFAQATSARGAACTR